MNAQHTKGPWEAPGTDDGLYVICTHKSNGKRRTIAHVITEYNARLISAAPGMYEALKIALRIIEAEKEACGIYKEHTEKIRAALAKADGN